MKHSYERKLNYMPQQFPWEICCETSFLHLETFCYWPNSSLKLTENFFYKCNWIFMKMDFLKALGDAVFCLVWALNQQSTGLALSCMKLKSIRWLKWSTSMISAFSLLHVWRCWVRVPRRAGQAWRLKLLNYRALWVRSHRYLCALSSSVCSR